MRIEYSNIKPKVRESDIKKAIRDYLRLSGWFVFHVMQGMGSYKGITDMIAEKDGITLFIEVKCGHNKQSEHQKKFEHDIITHGGHYICAYSVDDIDRYISENFGEKSLLSLRGNYD